MRVSHYDLDLAILPEQVPEFYDLWGGSIRVRARVDLDAHRGDYDSADGPCLRFAIYRLLQVSRVAVTMGSGQPVDIPFETSVEILPDLPTYQVRLVDIDSDALKRAAGADGRLSVYIEYEGPICGAREALPYVRDHVSEQYTLLREEVFWYPALYRDGFRGTFFSGQAADGPTYEVRITCPAPQTAVTGGTLLAVDFVPAPTGAPDSGVSWVRCHWRADVASFMGISCADYRKHTSVDGRVSLYCFPDDERAAGAAMAVVERTMAFCTRWLGPTQHGNLVVAEIPSGWGSQSSPLLILQTANSLTAALTEAGERRLYSELGHEVAHLWSVPSLEPENTRWLDEGMTHFMEALLLEDAFGREAHAEHMASYRQRFIKGLSQVATVPLAACGTHLYRDTIARGKGPWVLAVLREMVGDQLLCETLRRFTQTYLSSGATPVDFVTVAEAVTGLDLSRFSEDWFATSVSSELLASEMTVAEMAARYR